MSTQTVPMTDPDAASVRAVTDANPNIAAGFAFNASYFGIAELGGAATATVTGPQATTAVVTLPVDLSKLQSPEDLVCRPARTPSRSNVHCLTAMSPPC